MTDVEYENRLHNIYMKHYKDPIPYEDWNNTIQNLPKTYQLEFKDNFWDLSGSWFQNSLYWSKLWVVNPEVENPHRIFKGDFIKLDPMALSQVTKSPYGADLEDQFIGLSAPPQFSKPALSEENFPSSLPYVPLLIPENELDFSDLSRFRPPDRIPIPYYLSDTVPQKDGEIIGTDSYGRFFGVTGEDLILSLSQNTPEGTIYTVFETKKTLFSIESEVQIKALLKITGFIQGSGLYKAQIVSALDGISLKDSLFKGSAPSYTVAKTKFGKGNGMIIGSPYKTDDLFSVGSLVYLNKGSADGLYVEDSFYIIPTSKKKLLFKRPTEKTKTAIGVLKIIHTAQQKSTAVILSAQDSIHIGDQFTSLISPIELEQIEESEFLEQGSEFLEEMEEVETEEDFIDEQLQDPREEDDEDILEDFEDKEDPDDLFDGDFEIETEETFREKDLDNQEDQNLKDEFQYIIEGQDIEDSPADEELELEKEALESEVEGKKEINLKDENTNDDSLLEDFEETLEDFEEEEVEIIEDEDSDMEFIGNEKFLENEDNKETFGKEGFEEALEGLDEEDLEGLDAGDLEELETKELEEIEGKDSEEAGLEDLEDMEIIEDEDNEIADSNELEEFEEIDVL